MSKEWTSREIEVLMRDDLTAAQISRMIDRSEHAIRNKRWRLRNPEMFKRRRVIDNNRYYESSHYAQAREGRVWTDVEIEMIMNKVFPDKVIAQKIGRSVMAIQVQRSKLKSEGNYVYSN